MSRSILAGVLVFGAAACGQAADAPPREPQLVFPDAPPLKHRHRDYDMVESPDGQIRVYSQQKGDIVDLAEMRRLPEGGWSEPKVIEFPRRELNMSATFHPTDGRLCYVSDVRHPDHPPQKDDLNIWCAAQDGDGWGEPQLMPAPINTGGNEESPTFAPDGSLMFSTNRPGGEGGYDIYHARQDADGAWTLEPFPYNTLLADLHGALSPDGTMLAWFAHWPREQLYGKVDVFFSRLEDGEWSEPVNFGPMINTDEVEFGPGFSADGETFFFSRDGIMYEVALDAVLAQAGFRRSPEDES